MMERAFREAGVDARCLTLDVEPDQLAAAIAGMRAMGFRGAVFAPPHNGQVCPLLDELTDIARFLGRADCIYRDDQDRFVGDHTVGLGVVTAMQTDLAEKTAVVCGTGPEAQSIAFALAQAGPARLTVAGTSANEGESLVERLVQLSSTPIEFERTSPNVDFEPAADVVIRAYGRNVTDEQCTEPMPLATHLSPSTIAVDLPYLAPQTQFLTAAAAAGCQTVDGVDVLARRAQRAFHAWTGREASVTTLREAMEEYFMI